MQDSKSQFLIDREAIFNDETLIQDSFKFCVKYSLLVEEYILKLIIPQNINCVLAAAGGFSRRELSPFSDIDLMFIIHNVEDHSKEINECVTKLWDSGIEVSHTVRELNDIEKFMKEDLHAFTQFFETRFIMGNRNTYDEWNKKLFEIIEKTDKEKLIFQFFSDIEARHTKYGNSPKVLEPNLKYTAGGLRDLHAVEWMYSIKNKKILSQQNEITQTESFLNILFETKELNKQALNRLLNSYSTILKARNMLHILEGRKNDRLEFTQQQNIAEKLGYKKNNWKEFMYDYFRASTILYRFSNTMTKRYKQEFSYVLSEYLTINIDEDFELKGQILSLNKIKSLTVSEIMRAFYYECVNDTVFDQKLRSLIINNVQALEELQQPEITSSVFFRELLKLPDNVGKTLYDMNEVGFLEQFLPEFKGLVGFFQPGVYHCYTGDEHTIIALQNVEKLQYQDNQLSRIFKLLKSKDLLYLSILLHDIGKPISISGHEIIGAEIANSIMQYLGYGQKEIALVQFLIKNHLVMEQVSFRRNLNDPSTLDTFTEIFPSIEALDHLYLLTYADLSAVSPAVWTQWKADLLYELYRKAKAMLVEQLSGHELISAKSLEVLNNEQISSDDLIIEHLEQMDDISYLFHFTQDEINQHIEEIEKGSKISTFFKENETFTNITVITKDSDSLLAKLCGALSINDLNIYDARIFTRKDGIVIDSFNVTDFRTNKAIESNRYGKIEVSLNKVLTGEILIDKEVKKFKSKWKRLHHNQYNPKKKISINFEKHKLYTIIDVHAQDSIGLLYKITHKMVALGLTVYLAKISTQIDSVVDAFYVLKNNGEKLQESEYEFISSELISEIRETE